MKVRRVAQALGDYGDAASRRVPALHAHGTSYLFAGYLDFVFADLSTKLMTYPVLPYDDSRLNGVLFSHLDTRASPRCEKSTPLMKQKNSVFAAEPLAPPASFDTFCTLSR